LNEDAHRQVKPACQSLGAGREYERQIDQMVDKLYDLTEEEIKIVEGQK